MLEEQDMLGRLKLVGILLVQEKANLKTQVEDLVQKDLDFAGVQSKVKTEARP